MRITYPTYPQPIITHPATGQNWYLEVSNAGILRAAGTTTDAPTPKSRLRLVDPTGSAGYQLGLNTDVTPTVTATALTTPREGNYQDLSVWGVNGREWNLRVTAGGSITITAISSDWPMVEHPKIREGFPIQGVTGARYDRSTWRLTVSDAGILSVNGRNAPTDILELPNDPNATPFYLRSDDDSISCQLFINESGILQVHTFFPQLHVDLPYTILLISPSGYRFPLAVDGNGVLYIDDGLEAIDHANEWPLVLQSRNNILYVVDNRFPAPVPGGRGRGYGRRRE